jgi:hypothetical protein
VNMISTGARMTDKTVDEKIAESVLYDLWFSVAEMIFEKVCEVTQLDDEQKEALRLVALRPNDFHVQIESDADSI